MPQSKHTKSLGGVIVALALVSGCSTTQNNVHQFNPVPMASVGSQDLDPAKAKNATDLLRAANEEWTKGNESERLGDQKRAMEHYTRMLQYLTDADVNPAVFSGLRDEFQRIFSSNSDVADLFQRDHPEFNRELSNRAGQSNLFEGNVISQERVIAEIEDIKRRYPKNFQAGLDRSWLYRPYIEQQLVAAGLPKDLVWLPMVESLFQPTVVSRMGAVGMWQFMPSTGRRYGLRVDGYVDERRDWEKATRAAVEYLSDLYDFNNGAWALAVASYNMGEGGISRMVAMNGGERDIWRLIDNPPASDHMPEETKKFYPKLVAYSIVATSPKAHGFSVNPVRREETVRIPISKSCSLASLERAANLPSGTLKRLNPALVRGATPPGEYAIIVPAELREQMPTIIASLEKRPNRGAVSVDGRTFHVVRRGETLAGIAKKYDTDAKAIVDANKIRFANRIPVGKKLLIPTDVITDGGDEPESAPSAPEAIVAPKEKVPEPAPVPQRRYKVQRGDTLYKIALDNGVPLKSLQSANSLDLHARIHVGDELVIPGSGQAPARAAAPAPVTYTVVKGDTLAEIAQKFDTNVDDIVAANKLGSTTLQIGDTLVIASATGKAAAAPDPAVADAPIRKSADKRAPSSELGTYTVTAGDTLSGIAVDHDMKLSELRNANGLGSDTTIKVGQVLKVNGGELPAAPGPEIKVAAVTPDVDAAITAGSPDKMSPVTTCTVEKGQTLSEIASKYGVKISDLVAWNKLEDRAMLHIGDTLVVSAPQGKPAKAAVAASANAGTKTIHKVVKGQSPASIAKRYDVKVADMFAWNSWKQDHILHIGDEVVVYTK